LSEAEMLDSLPDAVVIVGGDRAIAQMNRAAERLTGWTRDEAAGRPWGDVVRLRDASGNLLHEIVDPFADASPMSSGSPEREYMLRRRGGGDRWVAVRTAYRRDSGGAVTQLVATIRDTNRRHRLERSAYDLIATLAHDLRSPLTSVKGFTSTMLRNWERFNDEQKQHMLHTIDWDADRMNRLLKDLLDLSRLEAGRLELKRQPVDVASLATQVAARVALDAPKYTVRAEFPAGFPVVDADPGKVEQVLVNLVENAVKHGDPGPVVVSGEASDGMVVLRVADAGPGIDAAHAPYVFTKFYRRGSGDRHAGTGLGLYICKGIIEAHGGEIEIERTSPAGTVFAFTLPRSEA
jgi:PAS domain S-box-containing protein